MHILHIHHYLQGDYEDLAYSLHLFFCFFQNLNLKYGDYSVIYYLSGLKGPDKKQIVTSYNLCQQQGLDSAHIWNVVRLEFGLLLWVSEPKQVKLDKCPEKHIEISCNPLSCERGSGWTGLMLGEKQVSKQVGVSCLSIVLFMHFSLLYLWEATRSSRAVMPSAAFEAICSRHLLNTRRNLYSRPGLRVCVAQSSNSLQDPSVSRHYCQHQIHKPAGFGLWQQASPRSKAQSQYDYISCVGLGAALSMHICFKKTNYIVS